MSVAVMMAVTAPAGTNNALGGAPNEASAVAPLNETSGASGVAVLLTNKRFSSASFDEALLELFASFVVLRGTAAAAAIAGAKGMVKIAKERMLTSRTLKKPGEGLGDKRFMNSP
jgi:DNA-binding phage protein